MYGRAETRDRVLTESMEVGSSAIMSSSRMAKVVGLQDEGNLIIKS